MKERVNEDINALKDINIDAMGMSQLHKMLKMTLIRSTAKKVPKLTIFVA